MDIPTDPASMQAYVLEQMLKGKVEEEPQASRAPAKFAKDLGERLESKLRDRLHHEIIATSKDVAATELLTPSQSPNISVSVFWDSTSKPLGIVRCDSMMRAMLGRLCFGGDVESPIKPNHKPATEAEMGLQQLLANLVAKALEDTGLAMVANLTTMAEAEFETEEFENREAYCFSFKIQIGPSTANLEFVTTQSLVLGQRENVEINQMDAVATTNEEMMQTPVLASVKLKPQPTTLGRVRSLQVGDYIPLVGDDQLNGQFVVSGQELFNCQIGRSGDSYSLKISTRADTEPNPIQALTPIA